MTFDDTDTTFAKNHNDFLPSGSATHVVNQVMEEDGKRYRFLVGYAWIEGKLTGRAILHTTHGEFEVLDITSSNPTSRQSAARTRSGLPSKEFDHVGFFQPVDQIAHQAGLSA